MLRESLCRSSDATSLPPTLHFPASLCLCVYYFNLKVRNSEVAGSRPRASICSSHQGQACSQAWGAEPWSPGGGRCEAECGEGGAILLVAHTSGGQGAVLQLPAGGGSLGPASLFTHRSWPPRTCVAVALGPLGLCPVCLGHGCLCGAGAGYE